MERRKEVENKMGKHGGRKGSKGDLRIQMRWKLRIRKG